jgi:hypothetical protein
MKFTPPLHLHSGTMQDKKQQPTHGDGKGEATNALTADDLHTIYFMPIQSISPNGVDPVILNRRTCQCHMPVAINAIMPRVGMQWCSILHVHKVCGSTNSYAVDSAAEQAIVQLQVFATARQSFTRHSSKTYKLHTPSNNMIGRLSVAK